jgi:hypothetical protein
LLGNESKKTTHYYTMALVSYDLNPSTESVSYPHDVHFAPVGIAIGNALVNVTGLESGESFSNMAQQQCEADYQILQQALLVPNRLKMEITTRK